MPDHEESPLGEASRLGPPPDSRTAVIPVDGSSPTSNANHPPNRVNLVDHWSEAPTEAAVPLELVRLGPSETVLVPFTPDMTPARTHYCEEPEVRGFVLCNGPGCILCRAGKAVDERALLPVYVPLARRVAVLAIGPSARPGALRPQVLPVLRGGRRVAMILNKPDQVSFRVATVDLTPGMDDGVAVIGAFLARWDAGDVDLASVYARLDDRDLAAIPGIAAMLRFKGVAVDDRD